MTEESLACYVFNSYLYIIISTKECDIYIWLVYNFYFCLWIARLKPNGPSPLYAGLQMVHAALIGAGRMFRMNL